MKKKVLSALIAGIMSVGLVACGGNTNSPNNNTSDSKAADKDQINVSVILKTTASEYWGYVMAGAKAYAADHPDVKVDVQGASSETAYDEQLNIIETNLASSQYDGYVIAPLQADMVATKIAGESKPIIAVDTKIEAPEILSFVGTGNEAAAKEGGLAAVAAAKEAGWDELTAISITGVQGDSTATARLNGYQQGVEEAGGTFLSNEIQYADAVADRAFASMEAIMQNHPKGVAMILCNNDDMAIAAARAARGNAAYAKTIFVGFDGIQSACKAILANEQTMSVAQNSFDMGYKAVEACVDAINGKTVETFIDSGSKIITIENAQEQLDSLKSFLGE